MRPDAEATLGELIVQITEAPCKPRARYADLKVLEAKLQELFVGQRSPGKIVGTLARHALREPRRGWITGNPHRSQDRAEGKFGASPRRCTPKPRLPAPARRNAIWLKALLLEPPRDHEHAPKITG